ncbi:YqcI/YcgG family protein [Xenorhabdus sp. XENO-1]|uniref:YqcI/YcgG family protein n=1 Tax=Xenorhabdus bovienii TaxID=40576 RepID=UPI0020CA49FF|nr:YqcI/YcgG family protein [Xenorhabdus bovienii]MCP9269640.1 YqcI/YcgG family protein [Xenorhabdus bovienii subsp. africana]
MLDDNLNSKNLISQTDINEDVISWHYDVFVDLKLRLDDVNFPCVFSKRAFRKQLLKFIFVDNIETSGIHHLAEGLKEYIEISREWDGSLSTAYPLIVAFSQKAIKANTVQEYHDFGWQVLQKLHDIDPGLWPENVGKDPNFPSWAMCFNGMQLFFNMSTPAARNRQSRNLGKYFIFVINPRERFDIVAGDTPDGHKVRENIRNRVERYDGISHALQLGNYSSGSLEWWQYGLIEENIERTDKCPFSFKEK